MHNKINIFFTETWQEKLRSEEMRERFEMMYEELFGVENYLKIKEIRLWLADQPNGSRLLSFLTDKDPYKG